MDTGKIYRAFTLEEKAKLDANAFLGCFYRPIEEKGVVLCGINILRNGDFHHTSVSSDVAIQTGYWNDEDNVWKISSGPDEVLDEVIVYSTKNRIDVYYLYSDYCTFVQTAQRPTLSDQIASYEPVYTWVDSEIGYDRAWYKHNLSGEPHNIEHVAARLWPVANVIMTVAGMFLRRLEEGTSEYETIDGLYCEFLNLETSMRKTHSLDETSEEVAREYFKLKDIYRLEGSATDFTEQLNKLLTYFPE